MPGDKIPHLLGEVRHWVPRAKEMIVAVNSGLQQETREQATYCHQLSSFKRPSRRLGTSWVPLRETSACGKSMPPHTGRYKFNCQHNPEKAACPILQVSNNDVKRGTRCWFFSSEWKPLNTITNTPIKSCFHYAAVSLLQLPLSGFCFWQTPFMSFELSL